MISGVVTIKSWLTTNTDDNTVRVEEGTLPPVGAEAPLLLVAHSEQREAVFGEAARAVILGFEFHLDSPFEYRLFGGLGRVR